MVPGKLLNLPAAHTVSAAVAGPETAEPRRVDGQPDDRAADRLGPRILPRQHDQLMVDRLKRRDRLLDEPVEIFRQMDMRQRVGHHRARDLTRLMPAHAVGNRPQPALRAHEDRILVDLAAQPDVGSADALEAHDDAPFAARLAIKDRSCDLLFASLRGE